MIKTTLLAVLPGLMSSALVAYTDTVCVNHTAATEGNAVGLGRPWGCCLSSLLPMETPNGAICRSSKPSPADITPFFTLNGPSDIYCRLLPHVSCSCLDTFPLVLGDA